MNVMTNSVTRRSPSPTKSSTTTQVYSRSAMVRDTVRTYSSKLPGPTETKQEKYRPQEEQHQEIMELKRSLATARHDLQMTKVQCRRQDEVLTRKAKLLENMANDQEDGRREDLVSSMSGSLNGVSGRPSLNRELVAKLRSMTETIKMLSLENAALRDDNETLREENTEYQETTKTEDARNEYDQMNEEKLRVVLQEYEKQVIDMNEQVCDLKLQLEAKEALQPQEKDKYKSLARRLKEERNSYRDMVDEKKKEQDELKVEIEKMSELIGELRGNCQALQDELLAARQVPSPAHKSDRSIQTSSDLCKSPLSKQPSLPDASIRRASLTENWLLTQKTRSSNSVAAVTSPRKITPKTVNPNAKDKNTKDKLITNGSAKNQRKPIPTTGLPKKGPVIAKPVQKQPSPVKSQPTGPQTSPTRKVPASPKTGSKIPTSAASRVSGSPGSRIPTPSTGSPAKSRIPNPCQYLSPRSTKPTEGITPAKILQHIQDREKDEILQITEATEMKQSTAILTTVGPDDSLPPPPPELESPSHSNVPPPTLPKPATLPKLTNHSNIQESQVNSENNKSTWPTDTPRTQRKVDSFRQSLAARKIQRTWKQFYEELEEKGPDPLRTLERSVGRLKTDVSNHSLATAATSKIEIGVSKMTTPTPSTCTTESRENMRLIEEEQERDEAISAIQSALAGHQVRSAALAAARSRGGIYTARPWVVTGSSDEEEEPWSAVQGILRAHSKRANNVKTIESMYRAGVVRASNNRSDGATDDDDDVMCT